MRDFTALTAYRFTGHSNCTLVTYLISECHRRLHTRKCAKSFARTSVDFVHLCLRCLYNRVQSIDFFSIASVNSLTSICTAVITDPVWF